MIEVAANARLSDGLPQEVHFLGPSLTQSRLSAVLDATKVDDFVDMPKNSLNVDASADMVSVLSEWLTEKEFVMQLRAHKVATASKLERCHGSLEAAMAAAGVDRKIFSVSLLVAGALASYEACWRGKVTANTRVSTMHKTLHKSALATLENVRTSCVDDTLKQLEDLLALPLVQSVTGW